jgi:hypothetical protein
MEKEQSRISTWLSVLTNVAILAGLLLVVYELNQNSELARVGLLNEGSIAEGALWLSLMNDAPNEVIAKSIECPERLTYADYIVLDSYLFTALNIVYRNYEVAQEGLFTQKDWKTEVEGFAHWYLNDPFGRTYWNQVGKTYFDEDFAAYMDLVLAKEGLGMHNAWKLVRSNLPIQIPSEIPLSKLCK